MIGNNKTHSYSIRGISEKTWSDLRDLAILDRRSIGATILIGIDLLIEQNRGRIDEIDGDVFG